MPAHLQLKLCQLSATFYDLALPKHYRDRSHNTRAKQNRNCNCNCNHTCIFKQLVYNSGKAASIIHSSFDRSLRWQSHVTKMELVQIHDHAMTARVADEALRGSEYQSSGVKSVVLDNVAHLYQITLLVQQGECARLRLGHVSRDLCAAQRHKRRSLCISRGLRRWGYLANQLVVFPRLHEEYHIECFSLF